MENNQQRNNTTNTKDNTLSDSLANKPQGQQPANNEEANSNRFAETNSAGEQHSESSKPDAENQTLGTP